MEDYYSSASGMACLGTGWDNNFKSNVGDAGVITPSPTVWSSNTPAPTSPTAAPIMPTPNPTYGGGDGCISVDLGFTNFDGTWDAIDGGYGGYDAYYINNNGYAPLVHLQHFDWNRLFCR